MKKNAAIKEIAHVLDTTDAYFCVLHKICDD